MSLPLTLVACGLAATAAGLALPGPTGAPPRSVVRRTRFGALTDGDPAGRAESRDARHGPRRRGPLLLVLAGAAGLVAGVTDGVRLALALVALGAVVGALHLAARHRAARVSELRRGRVVEVCELLAAELRAGQPLVNSVEHCVDVWPPLESVAAAARLDADVPGSLRRLSRAPGAEGLREVAAAWEVAAGSGAGLAAALTQVAATARETEAARRQVRAELSSAQATARLVAALPLGSLAMAAGVGADPWHFLLDTPAGVAALAVGVALAFAGLRWLDAIAESALRR